MKLKNKIKGFTLPELLVVIAILAILALTSMPLAEKIAINQKANSFNDEVYTFARLLKKEDTVNGDFNITNNILYKGNTDEEILDKITLQTLILKISPELLSSEEGHRDFSFFEDHDGLEFIYENNAYLYVCTWDIESGKTEVKIIEETDDNAEYITYKSKYLL